MFQGGYRTGVLLLMLLGFLAMLVSVYRLSSSSTAQEITTLKELESQQNYMLQLYHSIQNQSETLHRLRKETEEGSNLQLREEPEKEQPPTEAAKPSTSPVSPQGAVSRQLVIGMGTGIGPEFLSVFCASLREHSSANVVIFVDLPMSSLTKQIIQKYAITAVEFNVNDLQPPSLRSYHPSTYRWPVLYRFLDKYQDHFDQILLADIRDTFFQSDPFKHVMGKHVNDDNPAFITYLESKRIRDCGWNRGWIQDCFANDVYSKLAQHTISCSGISMGTTQATLTYLKAMNDLILKANFEDKLASKFPTCERNGVDQGIHNVLVRSNLIPHLQLLQQEDGMVAHMQSNIAFRERVAASQSSLPRVLNKKQQVMSIVHQYDRDKEFTKLLHDRFRFWNDEDMFMEEPSGNCEAYRFAKDEDLLRGVCDMSASSTRSFDRCCTICNTDHRCSGFVYFSGTCYYKHCKPGEIESQGVKPTLLTGAKTAIKLY